MRIPQLARKLKRRLLDTRTPPFTPGFAEHDLVMALRNHLEAARPAADSAIQSDGPELPACCDDVLAYFARRGTPSFFAGREVLAGLAGQMASSRPQWRQRLIDRAATDVTRGLKIYSMEGPPLRPGFPWGGLPSEPNDDDLYSIRPHRFAFAPRHALAILYGGEPAPVLADILEDWMAFAARGASELPYASTLVVIQRLVALSWAHAFVAALRDQDDPAVKRLRANITRIVHADVRYLMPRLGKCVPNNHLLADHFASWYIRLLFPEFVSGPVDLDAHEAVWLAELERQIYPDGTSFEHSLHYHEFACEMAAAYLLLCRRNGRPVPWAALQRIERMLDFQVELAGHACLTIPFGDAVEDPLFCLDTDEAWCTAGLRELHRALFRPDLSAAPPTMPAVERAFWLLGGALVPGGQAVSNGGPAREPRVWNDGGFAVLGDEPGLARLIFRTGPARHEHLSAGHMHADLLSVCVTLGDAVVLTDPGTWTYRWRPTEHGPRRSYFSGPAAHNGLAIDAIDPLGAVQGDFRRPEAPVRVGTTRCLVGRRLGWLEAEIFGSAPYGGYRRGVVHVQGAYWIIYDLLPAGLGTHAANIRFQTAAGVEPAQDEAGIVRLQTRAGVLWISNGPGLARPRIVHGESVPPGGWLAPTYGELVPAAQLCYGVAQGAALTALALGTGTKIARPVSAHVLPTGIVVEVEVSGARDRLVLATHDAPINVRTADVRGTAAAFWVRIVGDRAVAVRCLGFRETEGRTDWLVKTLNKAGIETMFREDDTHEIEVAEPQGLSASLSPNVLVTS